MRGDEGKLRQVPVNLVGNAVKFTEQGKVVLRAGQTGESGALKFPIPDRACDRSSETGVRGFYRAESTRGGSGLGLTIARRLVELMGGALSVNSSPGAGARFYFTIPLPEAEAPMIDAAPEIDRLARIVRYGH